MADVIIVLPRGTRPDGTLPPDPLARVRKGAQLFKSGAEPHVSMAGLSTHRFFRGLQALDVVSTV